MLMQKHSSSDNGQWLLGIVCNDNVCPVKKHKDISWGHHTVLLAGCFWVNSTVVRAASSVAYISRAMLVDKRVKWDIYAHQNLFLNCQSLC